MADSNIRLTTYYDGGCPLCSKEIAHYRRIDRQHQVRWVDLTKAPEELAKACLDTETAMRRLHVCAPDGRLISGVPAFIAIWQQLPGYRWLAKFVQTMRLTSALEWGYVHFADWRFRRRCNDTVCSMDTRS